MAALLLWIDWRSGRAVARKSGQVTISIANSLRETEKSRFRGWGSLLACIVILLVRPFVYTSLGTSLNWVPRINLLAISIPWRTDLISRMYTYSIATFISVLGIYYTWLLLLSVVARNMDDNDLVNRFVRFQLGWAMKLPSWAKLLLPLLLSGLAWLVFAPLLLKWQMLPPPKSPTHLWQQAALFALAAILIWRWLLLILFVCHFLNLYIYLGTHPFWNYTSYTASRLLFPLKWLRIGGLDLSPVAGALLVYFLSDLVLVPYAVKTFEQLPR